jgi:hypothetical protein
VDKAAVFKSLIDKDVQFYLDNKKLCYKSETSRLTHSELRWITENRQFIATQVLEQRLAFNQYLYQECVDFEYKPLRRVLSQHCRSAGYEAIQRLKSEITQIEQQIKRLGGPSK